MGSEQDIHNSNAKFNGSAARGAPNFFLANESLQSVDVTNQDVLDNFKSVKKNHYTDVRPGTCNTKLYTSEQMSRKNCHTPSTSLDLQLPLFNLDFWVFPLDCRKVLSYQLASLTGSN
ncbi:hypothetical protein PROFUN_01501 [Planoprotostelium fungivorum]|uniref:Uncharacterized protein n=1 Tax=Planoprotostelium fungivorum TaxID=1890364 RepID=A0A2P6NTD4_9EUKA|nr:hypothetical protein PROFUN_01501 [Planoprotostelium fungivorum]